MLHSRNITLLLDCDWVNDITVHNGHILAIGKITGLAAFRDSCVARLSTAALGLGFLSFDQMHLLSTWTQMVHCLCFHQMLLLTRALGCLLFHLRALGLVVTGVATIALQFDLGLHRCTAFGHSWVALSLSWATRCVFVLDSSSTRALGFRMAGARSVLHQRGGESTATGASIQMQTSTSVLLQLSTNDLHRGHVGRKLAPLDVGYSSITGDAWLMSGRSSRSGRGRCSRCSWGRTLGDRRMACIRVRATRWVCLSQASLWHFSCLHYGALGHRSVASVGGFAASGGLVARTSRLSQTSTGLDITIAVGRHDNDPMLRVTGTSIWLQDTSLVGMGRRRGRCDCSSVLFRNDNSSKEAEKHKDTHGA